MFAKLMQEVQYAKGAAFKQNALHKTYGRITMAWELKAITMDEYMQLNTACVREGINNPKRFN